MNPGLGQRPRGRSEPGGCAGEDQGTPGAAGIFNRAQNFLEPNPGRPVEWGLQSRSGCPRGWVWRLEPSAQPSSLAGEWPHTAGPPRRPCSLVQAVRAVSAVPLLSPREGEPVFLVPRQLTPGSGTVRGLAGFLSELSQPCHLISRTPGSLVPRRPEPGLGVRGMPPVGEGLSLCGPLPQDVALPRNPGFPHFPCASCFWRVLRRSGGLPRADRAHHGEDRGLGPRLWFPGSEPSTVLPQWNSG